MSELPPPFSPRKRLLLRIVGVLMIVGTTAPLVWWLIAGVFAAMSDAWPVMAAFVGVLVGAFLLFAAAHGRRVDPWPGNPQASWRRASLYWSLRGAIATIALIILIPLLWMTGPHYLTSWWTWTIWLTAVVALPFVLKRVHRLRQECRGDDRQASR